MPLRYNINSYLLKLFPATSNTYKTIERMRGWKRDLCHLTQIPGSVVKDLGRQIATCIKSTACFKNNFIMVFQMLQCRECYENVYN
jgi:hypothetical protein